jgi:hypothetical protein
MKTQTKASANRRSHGARCRVLAGAGRTEYTVMTASVLGDRGTCMLSPERDRQAGPGRTTTGSGEPRFDLKPRDLEASLSVRYPLWVSKIS